MRFIANLSQETQKILRRFYQQSRNHRVRQRAHCILLSFEGMTIDNLLKVFHTDRLTISHWLNAWEERHLAGLYDHKRPGRPQKLTAEEQQKIPQYIEQYPKDLKKVVHVIEQETHKSVSSKTVKRFLKKKRFSWKRIRKSPAKHPDPQKYAQGQSLIRRLQDREKAGECTLWYFDASGFCLTPCVPYAWQPIGSTIEIPTSAHNQRINVLGFLNRHNDLVPYVIEGKVDTCVIVECFNQFSEQIEKRTYVLLDNASMHKSKEFILNIRKWSKKGLIIKYLPPYSPELNLIEMLWRFMKYYWMPFSAYTSIQCLRQSIEDIIIRYNTDYKINFHAS